MEMNPKVKANWIEALESGKYKQGTGKLKNERGEFCCLGVLCDLYRKEKKKKLWTEFDWFIDGSMGDGGSNIDLPKKVQEWAGLGTCDPIVNIKTKETVLSSHNDAGCTFEEIANAIKNDL